MSQFADPIGEATADVSQATGACKWDCFRCEINDVQGKLIRYAVQIVIRGRFESDFGV